jgi:integrase
MERALLLLPDSKTGQKTIRLNAPALAVLQLIPRLADNPFVICGYRGKHLAKLESSWERIRKAAGLDDVRLHDLRHSFASVGAAGGQSLLVIGKLLGHAHARTTERYAHLGSDPLKAANDAIGGAIAAAMDGGGSDVRVVKTR